MSDIQNPFQILFIDYIKNQSILNDLSKNPGRVFDRFVSFRKSALLREPDIYYNTTLDIRTCLTVKTVYPRFKLVRAVLKWLQNNKSFKKYGGVYIENVLYVKNSDVNNGKVLYFDIEKFDNWIENVEWETFVSNPIPNWYWIMPILTGLMIYWIIW